MGQHAAHGHKCVPEGLCRESTEDCLSKEDKASSDTEAQVVNTSWQVIGSEAVPWSFPRDGDLLVELPTPPLALLGKPHGGNLTFRSDVPARDASLDGSCKISVAGSCSGSDLADSTSSIVRLREENARLRESSTTAAERAELERLREENRSLRERNKALLLQNEGLQPDDPLRIVPVAPDGKTLEPLPDWLSEDMVITLGPAVAKIKNEIKSGSVPTVPTGDEAVLCLAPCPKLPEVPRRCLENDTSDGTSSTSAQGEINVQLFGRREPAPSSDRRL